MKKTLIQIGAFLLIITAHLFYTNWQTIPDMNILFDQSAGEFIMLYIRVVGFIPGLAYALMGSFLTYAGYKYLHLRHLKHDAPQNFNADDLEQKKNLVFRGLGLASLIFLVLYFGLGLNGSWLFAFYVKKLSWIFSSLMKPLFLLITIISVLTGYIYIWRKTKIN